MASEEFVGGFSDLVVTAMLSEAIRAEVHGTADAESLMASRIVLSFVVGMFIILATALLIGRQRKAQWFRKRQQTSFFNRRGFAGEALHFGCPRTWQGIAVSLMMFGAIGLEGYAIVFASWF